MVLLSFTFANTVNDKTVTVKAVTLRHAELVAAPLMGVLAVNLLLIDKKAA
jgi:hypothetical protein